MNITGEDIFFLVALFITILGNSFLSLGLGLIIMYLGFEWLGKRRVVKV